MAKGQKNKSSKPMDKASLVQTKIDYTQGIVEEGNIHFPTLNEAATRNGLIFVSVNRHAKAENWEEERNSFISQYEKQKRKERLELYLRYGEQIDDRALSISVQTLHNIAKHISSKNEQGDVEFFSSVTLGRMLDTAMKAQRMGKLAMGEATSISRVETSDDRDFVKLIDALEGYAERIQQSDGKPIHRLVESGETRADTAERPPVS